MIPLISFKQLFNIKTLLENNETNFLTISWKTCTKSP